MPDEAVLDILAIVMGETLETGTAVIELLGTRLGVDMAEVWQADDALLDLIRDREVLDAMLAEVAGDAVASANAGGNRQGQARIIRDCLTGENGSERQEGFVPRWMAFPPAAYTARGGVGTVARAGQIASLIAPVPEPGARAVRRTAVGASRLTLCGRRSPPPASLLEGQQPCPTIPIPNSCGNWMPP